MSLNLKSGQFRNLFVAVVITAVSMIGAVSCQEDKFDGNEQESRMLPTEYQDELFTMVTLNVDGLPDNLNVIGISISINPEGPGVEHTPLIGAYLKEKGYDFIAVQENFNYNAQLCSELDSCYNRDQWGGSFTTNKVDWAQIKFPFDGINGFWKKSLSCKNTENVAWLMNYGKFDHAADDLITKGFRRYELQLEGSSRLVVYNMHMDASDELDEIEGLDGPDRMARMSQWRQLRDYILEHLDQRPVIVTGDLNSYYCRDSIKTVFMDYIESTGKATVLDAWIVLDRDGQYPRLQSEPVYPVNDGWLYNGEGVDKIICINPTGGGKLVPVEIAVDTTGYIRSDGTPLGDHFPLSATFRLTRSEQ